MGGIGFSDQGLSMAKHPYQLLPEHTRWSRAIGTLSYDLVDPVLAFPFKISAADKVATAGSCFAQHIARHLKANGFNYFVVEDGHPLGDEKLRTEFNYATFSARYGNIYTSRQLVQTFKRCYELFAPVEDHWSLRGRAWIDPFRPNIQPEGFSSLEELHADREQHFDAVRQMFEQLDIFVFTLGLTETWCAKVDGAVFPVCPGVAGGDYSDEAYSFLNLSLFDVLADMREFLVLLKEVNARAKVVLTVSPVPLIATAENRHVLVSTTYSKSVLRVACEELARDNNDVVYFPSYEIITGSYNRGRYFAEDLRSVTEEGVGHVMRLFMKHAAAEPGCAPDEPNKGQESPADFVRQMQNVVATICEEELVEASLQKTK